MKAYKGERLSENLQIWATYFMDDLFLKFYVWACRYGLCWNLAFVILFIQYFTYSVRSFHCSWNNNLIMSLYIRSTLNQRNSINILSTLFCQRWNNVDKHTSAQLSFSTKFQCWNNVDECWRITLFQRWFNVDVFPG